MKWGAGIGLGDRRYDDWGQNLADLPGGLEKDPESPVLQRYGL
jgi:hypothetical protein